jgi:phage tail sheath protein FI
MPEYLHPGVYFEEIERGPKPIEGVPTSTAAFIGETERGPTKPRLVTSYKDYQRWFGGVFGDTNFMPYAVNGFFENGGKRMYVCRVTDDAATPAEVIFGNFTVRAVGPESLAELVRKVGAPPNEIPALVFGQLAAKGVDVADFQGLAQPPRQDPQGLTALLDADAPESAAAAVQS